MEIYRCESFLGETILNERNEVAGRSGRETPGMAEAMMISPSPLTFGVQFVKVTAEVPPGSLT